MEALPWQRLGEMDSDPEDYMAVDGASGSGDDDENSAVDASFSSEEDDTRPRKRRHVDDKQSMPTAEEVAHMRESANSFRSHLFTMQVRSRPLSALACYPTLILPGK